MALCSVESCFNKHRAKGYCRMHYNRFIRNGSENRKFEKITNPIYINWDKVKKNIMKSGYIIMRKKINKKLYFKLFHHYVWENKYGVIPKGYDIHHINSDKTDNSIENLQLLSHSEHGKLHYDEKLKEEKINNGTQNV